MPDTAIPLTREVAAKVLEIVDAGLTSGLGTRRPGRFCVEAAVCYALGLPHGDDPGCVSPDLRAFKIVLNDANWSSRATRARGLRRLAIVQLGTAGTLDEIEFVRRLKMVATTKVLPRALRMAAAKHKTAEHREALEAAAVQCEAAQDLAAAREASVIARDTSDAAATRSWAAYCAAGNARDAIDYGHAAACTAVVRAAECAAGTLDAELSFLAEEAVQILVDMGVPGAAWLDLAPLPEAAQ